jgi:hypothetical protein
MIPLIGLLLCFYLVFKGFEIFQVGYSNPQAPRGAIVIGVVAIVASILIAGVFALLFIMSGASVPSLPRL